LVCEVNGRDALFCPRYRQNFVSRQNHLDADERAFALPNATHKIFHDDTAVAASILVAALPAILLGGLFTLLARRPFTQTRQALELAA